MGHIKGDSLIGFHQKTALLRSVKPTLNRRGAFRVRSELVDHFTGFHPETTFSLQLDFDQQRCSCFVLGSFGATANSSWITTQCLYCFAKIKEAVW